MRRLISSYRRLEKSWCLQVQALFFEFLSLKIKALGSSEPWVIIYLSPLHYSCTLQLPNSLVIILQQQQQLKWELTNTAIT